MKAKSQQQIDAAWKSTFSIQSTTLVEADCGTCGKRVKHGTIALNEHKTNIYLRGGDSYYDVMHHEACSKIHEAWEKYYAEQLDYLNNSINKL